LVIQLVKPPERPVPPGVVYALAAVAFGDLSMGFVMRKARVEKPLEVIRREPENSLALGQWRVGNLISFAQAETLTPFGVALKFLGASWRVAGIFFAVGLALIIVWRPGLRNQLP
jgi:hypothetical protein